MILKKSRFAVASLLIGVLGAGFVSSSYAAVSPAGSLKMQPTNSMAAAASSNTWLLAAAVIVVAAVVVTTEGTSTITAETATTGLAPAAAESGTTLLSPDQKMQLAKATF